LNHNSSNNFDFGSTIEVLDVLIKINEGGAIITQSEDGADRGESWSSFKALATFKSLDLGSQYV